MTEKRFMDRISKATRRIANSVVSESTSLTLKMMGKTLGYTKRGMDSVYHGTRKLFTSTDESESSRKKNTLDISQEISRGFDKAKGLFTGGLRKKFGLNKSEVKAKIAMLENNIREGYLEVGKTGSEVSDQAKLFDDPKVKALVAQIQGFETEINSLKKYLEKLEEAGEGKAVPFETDGKLKKKIQGHIDDCLRRARFALKSDEIVFRKALVDLLDDEMDIKRLAVSEIGKMNIKQAAPVLKEVLRFGDSQLQAEVINSLVRLEDDEVFSICKSYVSHDHCAIRAACIRGLYKSGREESVPYLVDALKDESVEVRNSSAMFLGWLEAKGAVSALLQAANDIDKRVRKNAILSLSNIGDETAVLSLIRLLDSDDVEIRELIIKAIERITGKPVPFAASANKLDRAKSVDVLKDWWISKRHGVSVDAAPLNSAVKTAPMVVVKSVAALPVAEPTAASVAASVTEPVAEPTGQIPPSNSTEKKWKKNSGERRS